jgi:plastocyanin
VTDLDASPPAFGSGALTSGASFQRAFNSAGTHHVYCTIHGTVMQATIIVQ